MMLCFQYLDNSRLLGKHEAAGAADATRVFVIPNPWDVWSIGLVLFGIHLATLGYLIYRSGYMPRWLGIVLVIDGLGLMDWAG